MVDYTLLIFILFNVFTFSFAFAVVVMIHNKSITMQDKMLKAILAKDLREYKELERPQETEEHKEEVVPDQVPVESLGAQELLDIQNRTNE